MALSSEDWRALLALNGDLVELAEIDVATAVRHTLGTLYRLTGAEEGFIITAVRSIPDEEETDPLRGWRPVHAFYNRLTEERNRLVTDWFSEPSRVLADPLTYVLADGIGRARTYLRHELVDDEAWYGSPTVVELLIPLGVKDRIYSGIPVAPDVELFMGLDRLAGKFGPHDREVVATASTSLGWLWRRLAASQGTVAQVAGPWSRREIETLRYLLTGNAEKQIAREIGVSGPTLHQYVSSVYRKLGVRSRSELMSRFVSSPLADDRSRPRLPTYPGPRGLPLLIDGMTAAIRDDGRKTG